MIRITYILWFPRKVLYLFIYFFFFFLLETWGLLQFKLTSIYFILLGFILFKKKSNFKTETEKGDHKMRVSFLFDSGFKHPLLSFYIESTVVVWFIGLARIDSNFPRLPFLRVFLLFSFFFFLFSIDIDSGFSLHEVLIKN